jgi:hypothetical protein
MKHGYSTCILAITLSGITLGVAHAQGKSADSSGHGGGSLSTQAGAAPQADTGSASTASNSVAPSQADPNVGNDAFGGYGQLGASQTTPIGESMFLQLYGGVDLDQQKSTDPAGALNGRVGLGWKY